MEFDSQSLKHEELFQKNSAANSITESTLTGNLCITQIPLFDEHSGISDVFKIAHKKTVLPKQSSLAVNQSVNDQ